MLEGFSKLSQSRTSCNERVLIARLWELFSFQQLFSSFRLEWIELVNCQCFSFTTIFDIVDYLSTVVLRTQLAFYSAKTADNFLLLGISLFWFLFGRFLYRQWNLEAVLFIPQLVPSYLCNALECNWEWFLQVRISRTVVLILLFAGIESRLRSLR